ncbi:DUF5666 domain-containing protein [Roseateles sp. BYS78W]|uniref:DUF5666 domain-containing protein n=1 Tax=Pelomonas candidula TaxID=3299025 RepID=A0ABW7H8F6_9BURK
MTHCPSHDSSSLTRRQWLALAGAGSLSACGGGGGDLPDVQPAAEPTAHPLGVATGGTGRIRSFLSAAITATSPLTVGGVSLDTRDAELSDGNGEALHGNDIAAGMTARVLAGPVVAASAQAYSVIVDTQVVGPAIWLDSRSLLVLGQHVSAPTSALRGPNAAGTPPDVQVWGRLDLAAGSIVATRIERAQPNDAPMLRGVLGDRGADWLQVGTLVARAADASIIPAGLAAGAVVRLVLGAPLADGSWQLLQARDDALRPPDGLEAELQGLVTQFTSARQFALDGVPVDASHAQIEGLAQLQAGATAEVRGKMVNGVLVATEVSAEAAEPLEISGRLSGLDRTRNSFMLKGWQVQWTAATRFGSGSALGLRNGRSLTVRGRWQPGAASLQALQITLE